MTRTTWALGLFLLTMVLGLTPGPIIPLMASSALADSLNAKPGAWKMTTTTLTTGMLAPPDVLAKMSPEQRAKIEAMMPARAGKPTTHVHASCMTQKDLDEDRIIKESDDEDQCTQKIITKSPSRLVVEKTCPAPRASTSKMTIEAKTPESIVASVDMTQGAGGKVHVDIKGHWLRASCAGIKDRD
jgi:flagellar motor protein MotB